MSLVKAQVVGGVFALASPQPHTSDPPAFLSLPATLLANARSGLWLLLQQLNPRQVWLPSFLCSTLVQVVKTTNSRLCFYSINHDLAIATDDWLPKIKPNDLVVLISYFGFPADTLYAAAARARGAWVVEDASQALLSAGVGAEADAVLFSPRKFVGVPDGGIVQWRASILADMPLGELPEAWWLTALSANVLRRDFDTNGAERDWFAQFQQAEATMPCGAYAMSQLSRALLTHAFDYPAIMRQRRANYARLSDQLARFAIFPQLLAGVVPLGFPIRTTNREAVRAALFAQEIYPPIHWPLDGWVPEIFAASHTLAKQILTLPCDQRYNAETMDRVAEIVVQTAAV